MGSLFGSWVSQIRHPRSNFMVVVVASCSFRFQYFTFCIQMLLLAVLVSFICCCRYRRNTLLLYSSQWKMLTFVLPYIHIIQWWILLKSWNNHLY